MRYLTLAEVLDLHGRIVAATGGASGLRDLAALETALAQPRQTFGGADLYPDLLAKATALAFGLIRGHPFVDGNKRIGHAASACGAPPNSQLLPTRGITHCGGTPRRFLAPASPRPLTRSDAGGKTPR